MKKHCLEVLCAFCLILLAPTALAVDESLSKIVVVPSTVTVSNSEEKFAQATAYDSSGNPIKHALSLISGDGNGVGMDKNGKITVSSDAAAGVYMIAAFDNTTSLSQMLWNMQFSAGLTVATPASNAARLDHIDLTDSVTLDGTTGRAFVAHSYDSNNQVVTGVTWTVSPDNRGVEIEESGVIHVLRNAISGYYTVAAAKNGVVKSQTLTVTNTSTMKTMTFSPGGSGIMPPRTADVENVMVMPECTFTPPEGMEFRCWVVNGREYLPGERCVLTGNAAAVAQWKPIERAYALGGIGKNAQGVTVEVANLSGDGGTLIVALYADGGQFLRMATEQAGISGIAKGASATMAVLLDTSGAKTAKAFLLNGDTRKPLCQSQSYDIE